MKSALTNLIRDTDLLMIIENNCSASSKAKKMLKKKKIGAYCITINQFSNKDFYTGELKKISGSGNFP
jgi:hypothetical protein